MVDFIVIASPRPAPRAARVICDPQILGGQPVIEGTRVPAATIVEYVRNGVGFDEIQADYPAVSAEGLRAVEVWAAAEYGTTWKSISAAPD